MKILICGGTGCVGRALVSALAARGHAIVRGARSLPEAPDSMQIDYMQPRSPDEWAGRLRQRGIDAVVNAVGILIPGRGQSYERIHAEGPIELFDGALRAGVTRGVQISALGVADDAFTRTVPYLATKLRADQAWAASGMAGGVLRPSMIFGPGSQSAALFATLAQLPVVSLPGGGVQPLAPVHVDDIAACAVRLLEQPGPSGGIYELGGPEVLSYREMLAVYRRALGHGAAWWLPVPMGLVKATSWLAEALPQTVLSRDTMRMLERGSVPARNATPELLGRPPQSLAAAFRSAPPQPWFRFGH